MKPAPFKYFRPDSVDETLSLLNEYGFDAKILAGGQSLVPAMNFRLAQPGVLLDINKVPDLAYSDVAQDGALRIGAMTRHAELEGNAKIATASPLIAKTMPHIGHPQIRNRGTIGGSLVHADPAAELPAVMIALDAKFKLRKSGGERWVPARDFFVELFMTEIEPEELLVEIEIPPKDTGMACAFQEVARRHGDFALAGAAVVLDLSSTAQCTKANIVLFGVGNTPMVASEAVKILQGQSLSEELIGEIAETAGQKDIDPQSDMHASAKFRRHLATTMVRRALADVFSLH